MGLGSMPKSKSSMFLDCVRRESTSLTVSSVTFGEPIRLLSGRPGQENLSPQVHNRTRRGLRGLAALCSRAPIVLRLIVSAAARTQEIGALFPELVGTKALGEEEPCYSLKVKRSTWTSRSAVLRASGRDSFKMRAGIARTTRRYLDAT